MHLTLDGKGPLTAQLSRALRSGVREGVLTAGVRLPSTRELARQLGLSRNIVLAAFEQLQVEGYLQARIGAGTYVARDLGRVSPQSSTDDAADVTFGSSADRLRLSPLGQRIMNELPRLADRGRADRNPPTYDFRYGGVPFDGISRQAWSRILARCARDVRSQDPVPVEGCEVLRAALSAHLRYSRGIRAPVERILITQGVQDAFDLTARLLLAPDSSAVVEDPHYLPARAVILAHAARVIAVPADRDGLQTGRLPRAGADLAYVTPSHQFPLGGVMPLARRHELLSWASKHGVWIFEDDYDSHYRYDTRPLESLASLAPQQILYASSFSKTLTSNLRVGFMVLPDVLVEPFRRLKALSSSGVALVIQRALAAFVAEGHYARHLRRMMRDYAVKRSAFLAAVDRHLQDRVTLLGTQAGVHVVMRVNDRRERDAATILRRLSSEGIALQSIGPLYQQADEDRHLSLLMSYVRLLPNQIEGGITRLARSLE